MTEAETSEKFNAKEYVRIMTEAQETRAGDVKSLSRTRNFLLSQRRNFTTWSCTWFRSIQNAIFSWQITRFVTKTASMARLGWRVQRRSSQMERFHLTELSRNVTKRSTLMMMWMRISQELLSMMVLTAGRFRSVRTGA